MKILFISSVLKSAVATFLLITFLFNFGGCYIILKFQQHQNKKEMIQRIREGVSDAELTYVEITSENKKKLRWKDDGKEFRYQGVMYDVIKATKIDKETTVYQCLKDTDETNILAAFYNLVKKDKKTKNNRKKPVKIFFKVLNKIPPQFQKQGIAIFEPNPKVIFQYVNYYNPPKLDVSSPPPKLV